MKQYCEIDDKVSICFVYDHIYSFTNLKKFPHVLRVVKSVVIVIFLKNWLKNHDYVKRKSAKTIAAGNHVDRNTQFERIAELRTSYESAGNPVVSVDTKKKELISNLSRDGEIYTTETIEVFDHDFPSLAEGVAIPHTVRYVSK